MGMGFGAFVNNTIKLPRMPSPMGKIQFAVIDIRVSPKKLNLDYEPPSLK